MSRHASSLALVVGVSLATLTGCAGYTQNVRAVRAYLYEEPSVAVAVDRAEDMDKVAALVEKILYATPYTPGDAWIEKIVPTPDDFAKLKAELRGSAPYDNVAFEVPVAKVYRLHLERVLASAPEKGKYASILEAVGELAGATGLKEHWETQGQKIKAFIEADDAFEKEYEKAYPKGNISPFGGEVESVKVAREARKAAEKELDAADDALVADLRALEGKASGGGAQLKELTRVVSVAYRANLEALAIVPVVLVQVVRAAREASKGDTGGTTSGTSLKSGKQIGDLPGHVTGLRARMTRQTKVLEAMTRALATASKQQVEQTPGFELKESVVDQVVGITGDSFRVNVRAGGEAFFFSTLSNQYDPQKQQQSGQEASEIKDYKGRLRGLKYEVKPIMLVAAKLDIGFDYIKLPNAGNFSLGFKTDRGFSSGGTVDNQGSFAQQVGATGAASDALDLGLGLLGVKTNVRVANFTAGKVKYIGFASDGTEAGTINNPFTGQPTEAPLQIQFRQIDVGYDLSFLMGESAGKYFLEELTVGGKFYQYALPRIMYELESTDPPDSKTKTYRYFNESAPQLVASKYYMVGATIRGASPPSDPLGWFMDFGLYVGSGPTAFYMRRNKPNAQTVDFDTDLSDSSKQELRKKSATAANVMLGGGGRYRFSNPGSRLKFSGELLYRAELIYARTSGEEGSSNSSNGATPGSTHIVDFGTTDVFHGPRFNLVGEF